MDGVKCRELKAELEGQPEPRRRPDVEAVYAQISELDPGEESWPFTDMALVIGTISVDKLREAVSALRPDEVSAAERFGVPPAIFEKHDSPVLAIWGD